MIALVSNDGEVYNFVDANQFASSEVMLMSGQQSTPIDLAKVFTHVRELSAPTVPMSVVTQNPTDEQRDALDKQYYWLFGSAWEGGMCFGPETASRMGMYLYASTTDTYQYIQITHVTGKLYLYDKMYYIGEWETHKYQSYFICASTVDSTYTLGAATVVILPTTPPTWTIGEVTKPINQLDAVPVQSDWDYFITSQEDYPEGMGVNATTNSHITLPILETSIGIHKSPYLKKIMARWTYVNWGELVDKPRQDPFDDTAVDDTDPGGDGEIYDSEDITKPPLPPDKMINSGIIKMFTPDDGTLQSFTNWIYSRPDQIITNLKKIWSDPMDSIISLTLVPFALTSTTTQNVKFCGVDTGITMPVLGSQYMEVNCGKIKTTKAKDPYTIPSEYKSFIDFAVFTKVQLFLPFIGIVDLSTDDVIGGTVQIDYNVDLFTGECLAFVTCTKEVKAKKIRYNSVLYTFKGNVIQSAPITGNNYQALYGSVLSLTEHVAMSQADPLGGAMGIAGDMISPKVNVQRSGSVTGNTGTLGDYKPYLIIQRPPLNDPTNNGLFGGYISNKYRPLKKCTGYTQIRKDNMRMKSTLATDQELDMIKQLLESGVIFPDNPR